MTAQKFDLAPPRSDFDSAWSKVRDRSDIQFQVEGAKPREPGWFDEFWRDLVESFRPLFEWIVPAFPVIRWVLIALLVVGVLVVLYLMLRPYIEDRRPRVVEGEDWKPDEATSRELLAEADSLADQGRFGEAARLLLYRSIEDIEKRRPNLLRPSNTAREIGRFDALSERARDTFGIIVRAVEAGFFAGRPVGRGEWDAARAAYRDFALADRG